MNVGELIEKLKSVDPNLPVMIAEYWEYDDAYGAEEIGTANLWTVGENAPLKSGLTQGKPLPPKMFILSTGYPDPDG